MKKSNFAHFFELNKLEVYKSKNYFFLRSPKQILQFFGRHQIDLKIHYQENYF